MPWDSVPNHWFSRDLEQDLHPFGCNVTGYLPLEHQLVKPDTTHADCKLKGVFLGWDNTTPTVWLWSPKLQREMCLSNQKFIYHLFPFQDQSVLVNKDLTPEDLTALHKADGPLDNDSDDSDYEPLASCTRQHHSAAASGETAASPPTASHSEEQQHPDSGEPH